MIAYHNVVSYGILHDSVRELSLSDSFLMSIAVIGMAAAYGLERTTRLVFLRERQLDRARQRADDLLRNTLPGSVVDRLQARDTAPEAAQIADGLESVIVLFADLVRFTEHASRIARSPARSRGSGRRDGARIMGCLDGARWPTGEPIDVRVGVASGAWSRA